MRPDQNYWGPTEATNPLQPPPSSAPSDDPRAIIEELMKSGRTWDQLTPSEKSLISQNVNKINQQSGTWGSPTNFQKPVPGSDYRQSPVGQPMPEQQSSSSLGDGMGNIGNIFGNVGNGIADILSQLGGQGAGQAVGQAALGAVNSVAQQLPGIQANDMANKEFDPQFQILAEIARQQQERYNQAKQATSQGYGALGNEYAQSRTTNKAAADQQVQTANQNYGQAAQDLSGNFNKSVQDNAAFLAKMGINEGQGELADNAQTQMAKELGMLTRQQQLDTGLASQLGTNQYQADTSGIANTKFAGQETADSFLRQFLDSQAQNDMQRLGLQGQKQKAINQYLMQIQQGQGQAENNSWERAFKEAGLGLERDKLALQSQGKEDQLNPYDALQERSLRLAGGNEQQARGIADTIMQAYQRNPEANMVEFLNEFDPEQLKAMPQLQALAFDFFNRIMQQNSR